MRTGLEGASEEMSRSLRIKKYTVNNPIIIRI